MIGKKRIPEITLNARLLPYFTALVMIMQILYPSKSWMILLVGLGVAWGISYWWIRSLAQGLNLKRQMRFGWAQVGDRLQERFSLENFSIFPALWVEVEDMTTLPGYSASTVQPIASQSHVSWSKYGSCTRRGVYMLGPTSILTGDPLGIYSLKIHYPATSTMMITPPVINLPQINIAPGGRMGEGRLQRKALQEDISSSSVRHYVPGDSIRWIHWKTSARRDSLYVKLFDNTPSSDWWIFLDLDKNVQAGEGDNSTLEHAIILTASLANAGLQAGNSVGLVTHGEELSWFPPQMGDHSSWQILRTLALVRAGEQPLEMVIKGSMPGIKQRSSAIIITSSLEEGWLNFLLLFQRRGIVPTILLLDRKAFGGLGDAGPMAAQLSDLGLTHYLITPDVVESANLRQGNKGQFDYQVTPSGRVLVDEQWEAQPWKELS